MMIAILNFGEGPQDAASIQEATVAAGSRVLCVNIIIGLGREPEITVGTRVKTKGIPQPGHLFVVFVSARMSGEIGYHDLTRATAIHQAT